MVKEIKLTQGKVALVDDIDFGALSKYSWHYNIHGYAKSRIKKDGIWKLYYLHRLVMDAKKGEYVDHINSDKLDNRRCNLRICTNQQNASSAKLGKNNITGFKGITWDKSMEKWKAKIMFNWKTIHIGAFDTKIDAAKAYDKAALKYFGEFAKTNKSMGLYDIQ